MEIIQTTKHNYKEKLAKAMKPFVLMAESSSFYEFDKVNLSSSLIDDKTVLGKAKISKKVKKVQYVIVTKSGVASKIGHHGQLRFVFDKPFETETGSYSDLIISWEAWRPAGSPLNIDSSMKKNHLVTSRAYVGPVRWLKDQIRDYDTWHVYDLKIRNKSKFFDFVVHKCMELNTTSISPMNSESELYKEYCKYFIDSYKENNIYFNLINNSCVVNSLMALAQFLDNKQSKELLKAVKPVPDWLNKAGGIKTATELTKSLYWLIKNNKILPARTYKYLKDAGLIKTKFNISIKKTYSGMNNPYLNPKKIM